MQRYKLFYNNAALSLIRYEHCNQTNIRLENCFAYSNSLVLDDILELFLSKSQSITIVYTTDEEEIELWKKLKSHFVCHRAAGGIVFKNNSMLSIYRFHHWDFPKGHVEAGETDEQAAIREVMEETGIDGLSISKDLGFTYHIFPTSSQFVLKETHWYEMQTENNQILKPQKEEDILEAKWIPLHEIEMIIKNTYPALIDLIERS